ncbi:fasciclin domain-containing protein [Brevundimonas viscosa]|uniref:Uncaracterized surface protein containing fasciclin (FAS1) repeats n=1 Tax=Brevundimonas viscosa TaxID=871741 RepID=A0A1I6Q3S8_9CAUL|nr:fasciclin domain-containing protein [Brevundimonas viscosa]SFS47141.1 Uncaracterized surface protein containing fasciclin (FAS1) repeats [Brevundimonas viscosa]
MRPTRTAALAALSVLVLAGCGAKEADDASSAAAIDTDRTLAAALDGDDGHDVLGDIADNAGLADVFAGVGPYTVFAPADAAFQVEGATDFTADDHRTEGAALVRAHVVPGALTRQDIMAAIDRSGGDGVAMRTMADGLLTFTREGDAIVVVAGDGARGRLAGEEAVVRNGVLQPVDALLVRPAAG